MHALLDRRASSAGSARTRPCRRCSARGRRRRCACDPAPTTAARRRAPSASTKYDASSPTRNSSSTTRSPAPPKRRSTIAVAHRGFRGGAVLGDHDALAGGQAVGLDDQRVARTRRAAIAASASSAESHTRKRAVGTPWRAMKSFANALLDSSAAAARVGPTIGAACARRTASTTPRLKRQLGTDDGEVDALARRRARAAAAGSAMSAGMQRATAAMPGFPGAQRTSETSRSRDEFPGHGVLAGAAADDENLHAS